MEERKWDACPLCGGAIHFSAFAYVTAHQVFAQHDHLNWDYDGKRDHLEFAEGEFICSNDHDEEQMMAAMKLLAALELDYDGIEQAWDSYHGINSHLFD